MRCQGDHVPGLGTRAGSTLLFSTTARFCDKKKTQTKLVIFDFKFDCYNKLNVGSLVRDGSRIFNEFIVGIKSYISETSDQISVYETKN